MHFSYHRPSEEPQKADQTIAVSLETNLFIVGVQNRSYEWLQFPEAYLEQRDDEIAQKKNVRKPQTQTLAQAIGDGTNGIRTTKIFPSAHKNATRIEVEQKEKK